MKAVGSEHSRMLAWECSWRSLNACYLFILHHRKVAALNIKRISALNVNLISLKDQVLNKQFAFNSWGFALNDFPLRSQNDEGILYDHVTSNYIICIFHQDEVFWLTLDWPWNNISDCPKISNKYLNDIWRYLLYNRRIFPISTNDKALKDDFFAINF